MKDGLIHKKNRILIPNVSSIKTKILQECHVGVAKTIELVSRQFYWNNMYEEIHEYVTSCLKCQANKSSNMLPSELLQSLPIPSRAWEQVTMDLITQLPRCKSGNDAIIVFVDKLTKMVHYVACKTKITAPQIAHIFYNEIIRLHGVPKSIVSDRDVRFTSMFWKTLWKLMGTKLAMSTAYHPQTDGQTERVNRTLEGMLRAFVNYEQDDWDTYLDSAEIAYNNIVQISSGFSHYLNYRFHPSFPLSSISNGETSENPSAEEAHRNITNSIEKAIGRQTHYANQNRRDVLYKVGDQFLLTTANLTPDGRSRKFASKFIGPYRIIEIISPLAYKLVLSDFMKLQPVFHVSKLKLYKDGYEKYPEREEQNIINTPVTERDLLNEELLVEKIIGKRVRDCHIEYLVKWKDD